MVNFRKVSERLPGGRSKGKPNPAKSSTKVMVDLLLHVLPDECTDDKNAIPKPCTDGQVFDKISLLYLSIYLFFKKGEVEIVSVESTVVTHISSVRLFCPNDLRQKDARKGVFKSIKEVKRRYPEGPPLLNPIDDMKITEQEFVDAVKKIESLEKKYFIFYYY